ncbi:MAG: SOS response-associated peptidase [Lachnospiraceae bacterium]|nr:SOS response-associated peptidase [Lachnospiraceae bacterium]
MCGRYYVMDDIEEEAERFARDYREGRTPMAGPAGKDAKDVHPTETGTILRRQEGRIVSASVSWGIPVKRGQPLIINARSEEVWEKPLFRERMEKGRCVIPAMGFYEWDREKNKASFCLPDRQILFLAGLCGLYGGKERFVILTRDAQGAVRPVHHRMPCIIPASEVPAYLAEEKQAASLLSAPVPELLRTQEYVQQTISSFF